MIGALTILLIALIASALVVWRIHLYRYGLGKPPPRHTRRSHRRENQQ